LINLARYDKLAKEIELRLFLFYHFVWYLLFASIYSALEGEGDFLPVI